MLQDTVVSCGLYVCSLAVLMCTRSACFPHVCRTNGALTRHCCVITRVIARAQVRRQRAVPATLGKPGERPGFATARAHSCAGAKSCGRRQTASSGQHGNGQHGRSGHAGHPVRARASAGGVGRVQTL